jgi:uncharacterized protein
VHLQEKADRLAVILLECKQLAIAFSGGIDSALLLKCALDVLGAGNVLVLFARSQLLTSDEIARAEGWPAAHGYPHGVELETIIAQPLAWKEFVSNSESRCYFCKLRLYTRFKERMEKRGYSLLADGTNIDDLKSNRPGLRAIHELGVRMPLVEAGLDKTEVRRYSRQLGLADWNRPSSSCLATRIPEGLEITGERLDKIRHWEQGMEQFGFAGCRVRMDRHDEATVCVQLIESDFDQLNESGMRLSLLRFFQNNDIRRVLIDLKGR